MAYTTINKSSLHMNTKLFTGNGSTNAITGVGFQPDLVWIKDRDATGYHFWTDAVRGVTKTLFSNGSDAESTEVSGLTAFGTDGFTVGNHSNINTSGRNIVAWNWKANGAGSANTDGSINSTVSVNTTAGFSIVSYTGNGTAGATIGHGLGTAPRVVLIKRTSAAGEWIMGHGSLGFTKFLELNLTGGAQTSTLRFNDTAPTNQFFTVGSTADTNQNGTTLIAYCFAEKKGFSKFGSYTGNGNADGSFIYTGFAPSFVMTKNTAISDWWGLWDNKRLGFNSSDSPRLLQPNLTDAEPTSKLIDFTSNGFKIRSSNGAINGSGNTVIYMAFGQSIVGSNNVCATAR